jgi:hypothetical protein
VKHDAAGQQVHADAQALPVLSREFVGQGFLHPEFRAAALRQAKARHLLVAV